MERVSVRDLSRAMGKRSFIPFILVVALLLVSPLSGVPGVPTVSAIIIVLLALQSLAGRRRLWLPDVILRRQIPAARLRSVLDWLRRPCGFIDRHTRPRLLWLSGPILRPVSMFACVIIPLGWPLLEFLPFVSSTGAATVAMLVFGLFSRDGLFVLAGYGMIALTMILALGIVL
ncbi:exopolysaccharide biosynthesis protein [Sulfitobacter albidus]|uniref:exopolysaccharide biosynthesis protein n=1 Tax=Sulfitobacter albidus TaxID=2829501 RepID=UPI0020C8D497|nr:exopolysaccharide biosynthesis protein [Sulfitobacter albidus]